MLLVAFSGKKDSGKDTGANHLAAHYLQKYNPRIKPKTFGFSYPLKKFCAQWFGLSLAKLNGTDEERNELTHLEWRGVPGSLSDSDDRMTYREVLQIWGTDVLRHQDPACHVRRWEQEISEMRRQGVPLVTTCDARFPNEIGALLELGDPPVKMDVRIVRLTRHPHPGDEHTSETALDSYDWKRDPRVYVLDNTESEADYKRDLLRWFEHTYSEQLPSV
jgi:hypothetical protein